MDYCAETCALSAHRSFRGEVAAPLRSLLVMTHHKCASAFVSLYLSEVCDLNGLRLFASHLGTDQPQPEYNVSLLANARYAQIKGAVAPPAIHIIRNPLDIVVSAYYSHRSTHGEDGWPQLRRQRSVLASCGKEAGFFLTLAFLEQDEFYPYTPGPLHALRGWCFDDTRIQTIRMEDLVANVNSILGKLLVEKVDNAIKLPEIGIFLIRGDNRRPAHRRDR